MNLVITENFECDMKNLYVMKREKQELPGNEIWVLKKKSCLQLWDEMNENCC